MARPQEQKDFESYNQRKFTDWKDRKVTYNEIQSENQQTIEKADNRTEEQKAFDDYLQTRAVSSAGAIDVHVTKSSLIKNPMDYVSLLTGGEKGAVYYEAKDKKDYREPLIENALKSGVQTLLSTTLIEHNKFAMIIQTVEAPEIDGTAIHKFERVGSSSKNRWYEWKKVESGGGGTVNITAEASAETVPSHVEASAHVDVTNIGEGEKLTFKFQIPQGEKGEKGDAGGGGGVAPIPKNREIKKVTGEFGVNLFDYRELSRDSHFKTNGKVFSLEDKGTLLTDPEEKKKLNTYNRLYEGISGRSTDEITFDARLLDSTDPIGHEDTKSQKNKFKMEIYRQDLGGNIQRLQTIQFNNDTTLVPDGIPKEHLSLDYSDNYSYLRLDIGGDGVPANGKIEFNAYYGKIKPQGLEQKFEFKQYNGFELKKNRFGTADEYIHKTWGDVVNYRLGVLNLKDAKLVKIRDAQDTSMIIIEAPEDIWIPETFDNSQSPTHASDKNKLFDNLMSSNLCDITLRDAEQAGFQNKPFFVKYIDKEPVIKPDGSVVMKYVMNISIAKENRGRWLEHLSKTQIIYPIIDPAKDNFIPLPLGGYKFTLNSGDIIETNKYSKIAVENNGYKLSESPFGYSDVYINANNIASTTMQIVTK